MTNSKFQTELMAAIVAYKDDFMEYHYQMNRYEEIDHPLFKEKRDAAEKAVIEKQLTLESLISRCADLDGEKMIYKHQCGHCQRFSPLPFEVHVESFERWKEKR